MLRAYLRTAKLLWWTFFVEIFNSWDKLFKSGLSKFCGRQPLKNLNGYGLPQLHYLHKKSASMVVIILNMPKWVNMFKDNNEGVGTPSVTPGCLYKFHTFHLCLHGLFWVILFLEITTNSIFPNKWSNTGVIMSS